VAERPPVNHAAFLAWGLLANALLIAALPLILTGHPGLGALCMVAALPASVRTAQADPRAFPPFVRRWFEK